VNSEFAVAPRDKYPYTFFRDRSDPEGRRYQAKDLEAKQKKGNKKETETS